MQEEENKINKVKKLNTQMRQLIWKSFYLLTRQKVLKVAKIKDANYGCLDEYNESVSQFSEVSEKYA